MKLCAYLIASFLVFALQNFTSTAWSQTMDDCINNRYSHYQRFEYNTCKTFPNNQTTSAICRDGTLLLYTCDPLCTRNCNFYTSLPRSTCEQVDAVFFTQTCNPLYLSNNTIGVSYLNGFSFEIITDQCTANFRHRCSSAGVIRETFTTNGCSGSIIKTDYYAYANVTMGPRYLLPNISLINDNIIFKSCNGISYPPGVVVSSSSFGYLGHVATFISIFLLLS